MGSRTKRPAGLDDLLADIDRQDGTDNGTGAEPVVTLELFFDGNDDSGSIGCNLTDHPGIDRFHTVLRGIRDRVDVHGVWVGITEVMTRTRTCHGWRICRRCRCAAPSESPRRRPTGR